MPVDSERGDVTLIFSGEEFPAPDTARRLEARAHRFPDRRPAYLVHLYEDDPGFPAGLNGRFHGVVADRARGTAMLFTDRYGMHRLYCHEAGDSTYVAAEAKAILAVRPELRTVDADSLAEFVSCGCVLGDRTLFAGLRLLPAAAIWTVHGGAVRARRSYFHPRHWEEQAPLEPDAYRAALRHALASRLPSYLRGPEPIGVALTGGLDTRLIMGWQDAPAGSLRCYTIGGTLRDSQDVRLARRVAGVCQQPHDVISAGPEFLARFGEYAERSVYLSDGCADVSHAPDLYVSERARMIAPVKVVGTYGSEILAQVPAFAPAPPAAQIYSGDLRARARRAEAGYAELRREHPVTFAAFRQSPWWHHGVLALEETQLTVRTPYLDNEFVRTVFRAPARRDQRDIRAELMREASPSLGRIRTDRGIGGSGGRLRTAVARGVLEFTFRAEHAYDYAMPQWLAGLDHWLGSLRLERLFLGRHKPFHFRVWYRGALARYLREVLLDPRTLARPYLEARGVESIVEAHLRGDRNHTGAIHKILTLELIHRLFVDSAIPLPPRLERAAPPA
jgi:asparagine synthase (glutamine-hydrolysing)